MALFSVIKYEGPNDAFVWKHPVEDFNNNSQLIVHESQEAYLFLDGELISIFSPGRHTLTTMNGPIVTRLLKRATGGKSPFPSEVWFVNHVEQMGIPWGTSSPAQYVDPTYGIPLSLGASGDMSIAVEDGDLLLRNVVGTDAAFSQKHLIDYFKSTLQAEIKSALADAMSEPGMSIFTVDKCLPELSDKMQKRLSPSFAKYGLELTGFAVGNVVRPENSPEYQRLKDLQLRAYADIEDARIRQQVSLIDEQTTAERTVIASQAAARSRELGGYTYKEERSFDVAEKLADNEGLGQYATLGIGLGTMAGIGATVGGMVGDVLKEASAPVTNGNQSEASMVNQTESDETEMPAYCPRCGRRFEPGDVYCSGCGRKR